MDFIKIIKTSRFLDPARGFAETKRFSEVRVDPLTGHTSRVLDFPVKELGRENLSRLVEDSRAFCPFCPEVVKQVTPKFHPDLLRQERYAKGDPVRAQCVSMMKTARCALCQQHYLALKDFLAGSWKTPSVLFRLSQRCCPDLPDMVHQSVNWNYALAGRVAFIRTCR